MQARPNHLMRQTTRSFHLEIANLHACRNGQRLAFRKQRLPATRNRASTNEGRTLSTSRHSRAPEHPQHALSSGSPTAASIYLHMCPSIHSYINVMIHTASFGHVPYPTWPSVVACKDTHAHTPCRPNPTPWPPRASTYCRRALPYAFLQLLVNSLHAPKTYPVQQQCTY